VVVLIDAGLDLVEAEGRAAGGAGITLSAVINAIGLTVAAIAETASEPFRKPRREKRAAMISPIVRLSVGLWPGPSLSSSWLVRNFVSGETCSFIGADPLAGGLR
jgi:hypothetical protein